MDDLRKQIVETAKNMIGYLSMTSTKIRNEGLGEPWFDCSGFICVLLEKNDIDLNGSRFVNELFDNFGVLVHEGLHIPGDLVFFTRDGIYPAHIGIVISATEYIHAPGYKNTKIKISKIQSYKFKPRSDKGTLIYNSAIIGFKRITLKSGRYHSF
jgi:hypothetical protein